MRGSAWRRRREAAQEARRHAAIQELFALHLESGAVGPDGTPYHTACAPPGAREGFAWGPDDATVCKTCGGPLGQPPVAEVRT